MENSNELFGGRKILIEALTGSHNYNLNTPESDEDFKYFVAPNFDDLYGGKMFSHAKQSNEFDYSCHDIRQLSNLLWKANLNFIEVLFSRKVNHSINLIFLYTNSEDFAKMNLPAFAAATYGMHLNKMKNLHKGTEKTKVLVEKFGYDTKEALHALRCLYVLEKMAKTGSFTEAIWFENDSHERNLLLDLKAGKFSETDFLGLVNTWKATKKEEAMGWFDQHEPNFKLKEVLDERIKNLVKRMLN